ncbi:Asp-tRNA(Asn)/Glu-tRNA(Gln) amidotransferase subunit GatB [archaeon]|nr:MAG: Asp-tRNA(Asn)/Glu-tRNA(Gln) amidotransferase subunit GatB [archaeon]
MKTIMGLEVHIHMLSESKLFCSCPTDEAEPNENTCPICLGFPGAKPKLNKRVLDSGIMIAKALNCSVNPSMFFSRKVYFYPDMSKNYQITQYEIPVGIQGHLDIGKKIRIRRVHIEEDPAKLMHIGGTITSAQYVLVDYNRSGMPLMEIVTEPDFENVKEVREFLSKLQSILEHLEVYDPNGEASLRVDANISLEGGERIEVKNITGFANVEKALTYEIIRQTNLVKMGRKIERETRHFNAETNMTESLRKKEFEEDYGYIFEPDLPRIDISHAWIAEIEKQMPELPDARVERFMKNYGVRDREAKILVYVDKALADFFERCAKIYKDRQNLANWIVGDLMKALNSNDMTIRTSKVAPEDLVEILKMVDDGEITGKVAKGLVLEYVKTGRSPRKIVEKKDLILIESDKEIEKIVSDVVSKNQKAVDDYKAGNEKTLQFLIGQVMKESKGKVKPDKAKEFILKKIK